VYDNFGCNLLYYSKLIFACVILRSAFYNLCEELRGSFLHSEGLFASTFMLPLAQSPSREGGVRFSTNAHKISMVNTYSSPLRQANPIRLCYVAALSSETF
jgi:hypothetical protein